MRVVPGGECVHTGVGRGAVDERALEQINGHLHRFFIGTVLFLYWHLHRFFIGTNLFFKRRFTGESGRDPGLAVETINVFVSLKSAFSYLLFVSLKMYLLFVSLKMYLLL